MKKKYFKKIALVTLSILISFSMPFENVLATTNDYIDDNDIMYYTPGDNCDPKTGTIDIPTTESAEDTVWNSGITGPYIVEQYAIEVLKNIAAKKGIDPSNTVTNEHVLALVAFAWGEGGDIKNEWLFNLYSSGINAPELIEGEHGSNGTQSYKSFDAGVEATSRHMLRTVQSRTSYILSQKNSTAEDFFTALTYYKNYEGNKLWSEESVTDTDGYLAYYRSIVSMIRRHYNDYASIVIGTNAREGKDPKIQDYSKLNPTITISGDSTAPSEIISPTSTDDCPTIPTYYGTSDKASLIVQKAIELSWPEPFSKNTNPERKNILTPKSIYTSTMQSSSPGSLASFNGADCGGFVATVVRSTGIDPNYPSLGTRTQTNYILNNPDKYIVDEGIKTRDQMQPGDILIAKGGAFHTFIYIGPQSPAGYDVASASYNERMPNLGFDNSTCNNESACYRIRAK